MLSLITRVFASVLCLSAVVPAEATLIGDTVDCDVLPSNTWSCIPTSASVESPGVEFELLGDGFAGTASPPSFDLDIEASSISMVFSSQSSSLGLDNGEFLTISDLNWVDAPGIITGVQLQTSGVSGLDMLDILFGNDYVTVDFNNTGWSPGDSALITLEVAHSAVPEPATLSLMGLGIAGLVFRKKKQA